MTKSEKIKLFGINFFTKIMWRIVVKEGGTIPSGPYMLVYKDFETLRGIFWLIPVAIILKTYRFIAYWYNRWRTKPNIFDKILRDAINDSYVKGYQQSLIDNKGTERRLNNFRDMLKTQGIGLN